MTTRCLFIILLLSILSTPSMAQLGGGRDEVKSIKFNCDPTDAKVYVRNEKAAWELIGRADEPIAFDVKKFDNFKFSAEGYKDREEVIPSKSFNSGAEWPGWGVLELKPLPLTRAKLLVLRWGWILLVIIPAVAAVRKLRREKLEAQERSAMLEELQAEAMMSKDTVLGQRLGKYLLTKFLGKGGMAAVYRGTSDYSPLSDNQVAVKVLSAVDDEQTVARFHREVQICQKLIHPNIVALHDWGREGELIFLALELVEGGSLEDQLEKGIEFEEALRIFDEVLAGMEFAHSQGVTHRDLKPDNILMTGGGKPKVADFGLAKLQAIKTVTVTGAVMGTPAYMAPEQIQGHDPSPSMDQYALGVMAFQMFTGSLPFEAEDMMVVITKHLIEEPPNPRDRNQEIPQELADLIVRMMQKDPGDRFADLGEVRRALKALPEKHP